MKKDLQTLARSKGKSLNKFWLRGKSDELNLNIE
jgi:hypothetical protein